MADQFIALCEETTRGTMPGSPSWLYLPITGKLQPSFAPKDESRKEFRGADTALGDSTVLRRESQWTWTLECNWYPGPEVGLLLKHLLGKAGSRSTVDTSGKRGILYPLAMPYGTGYELEDKAIGFAVHTDEAGTSKYQYWGGGRVKSCTITLAGTDDVKLSFEIVGAGEWIGAPDQTALGGVSFPTVSPFVTSDALFCIGSGVSRTGTAPDFTAIGAGTMDPFRPDDVTITITNGLDDKVVINGIKGPSLTSRMNQFTVEVATTIDYADPGSGFSSADEFKSLFSGTRTNSLLMVLDNGELAGAATATYQAVLDFPLFLLNADTPERNTEGKTPSTKLTYRSLYSATTEYPFALMTTDKAASY